MRTLSFQLDDEDIARLDELATRWKVSRAAALRIVLTEGLKLFPLSEASLLTK